MAGGEGICKVEGADADKGTETGLGCWIGQQDCSRTGRSGGVTGNGEWEGKLVKAG